LVTEEFYHKFESISTYLSVTSTLSWSMVIHHMMWDGQKIKWLSHYKCTDDTLKKSVLDLSKTSMSYISHYQVLS